MTQEIKLIGLADTDPERNWDNHPQFGGGYLNKCCNCGKHFLGHKLMFMCKLCYGKATK
jgi:hypothetical protein